MIAYDDVTMSFDSGGAAAGLDAVIQALQYDHDHHALFRALLLKKRYEMGLPLINPGELRGFSAEVRKKYEDYVEETCREIGQRYLNDGNIVQAWRYYKTVGDHEPIRAALENLDPREASEEILTLAISQGAHPRRGFLMTLEAHGLCRAISVFDQEFSVDQSDKRYAAELLVRQLYKELVIAVRRHIMERFGELPPETDLVELIRLRPWLFENNRTHADPQHVSAIARIGLITEKTEDLIMCLSIAEYGRMLAKDQQPWPKAPFEAGFADQARFARALLGQGVADTCTHFRSKLAIYGTNPEDRTPVEMVVMLLWRTGQKEDALDVWQQYLGDQPPEIPGIYIPSFYDLCIEAKSWRRLGETARLHGDSSAWAASRVMETEQNKRKEEPAAAPVQASATETLS
ncbi:MAG TPA: hypothetical protein VEK08_04185 [Planctomycetota bacterium]|nr:hypothetical protein [Planctomycetota bacterium]